MPRHRKNTQPKQRKINVTRPAEACASAAGEPKKSITANSVHLRNVMSHFCRSFDLTFASNWVRYYICFEQLWETPGHIMHIMLKYGLVCCAWIGTWWNGWPDIKLETDSICCLSALFLPNIMRHGDVAYRSWAGTIMTNRWTKGL